MSLESAGKSLMKDWGIYCSMETTSININGNKLTSEVLIFFFFFLCVAVNFVSVRGFPSDPPKVFFLLSFFFSFFLSFVSVFLSIPILFYLSNDLFLILKVFF